MKKLFISAAALLFCLTASSVYAADVSVEKFTHQNVPGSQTCYTEEKDKAEIEVTQLPDVYMGMRINNPVIRAYLTSDTDTTVSVRAEQYNKFGKLLNTDEGSVNINGGSAVFEFNRVRNADSVKIYADGEYIGGLNDTIKYENGIHLTEAPSDYQIYQRDDSNKAVITFAGDVENNDDNITIHNNSIDVTFSEDQKDAVIVAAQYNSDGSLKSVDIKEKDGATTTMTSPTPYENVKVMVWDSLDNMNSIYESKTPDKITVSAVNKSTNETVSETVDAYDDFRADLSLEAGLYDIDLTYKDETISYENVGVGDIWVAAGQSNMTDMGAITDGFDPQTEDPIIDGMHIMYAEDTTWQKMSHPAGEGRFFKSGIRTSPVTSFAREIVQEENVPVGIIQSSVGGTNIYQWASGVKPGDALDGYLLNALESCFDNMPSTDVKGILWYQGCNDAINEVYAYDYENLQNTIFTQMREFFGEDTPIITTQINDANQDSTASLGYYDAWSYVKDVQRRNPELYDNVYVVGTSALDLGDTIHNSAKSNLSVGDAWAKTALNRVYGKTDVRYLHPTIDTATVKDSHTIELVFKNTGDEGLFVREDTKRIGITNGLYTIQLGDLKQEFVVRQGGSEKLTSSNTNKGTELNITDAVLQNDGKTVLLTTEEEMSGTIAVDCCYGKRFAPSLTDKETGWSVLSFYNVIAKWDDNGTEVTEPVSYKATDTALLSQGAIPAVSFGTWLENDIPADSASAEYMYLNKYQDADAYPIVKFDLSSIDTSHISSAKLKIYTYGIDKDRNGNITVSSIGNDWDNSSTYSDYASISSDSSVVCSYEGVNTSAIFPTGNYSEIDVTDYIRSFDDPKETSFMISSTHVAVALMAGIDSENPPELVIQPGKAAELTYTDENNHPVNGLSVTISGTGPTNYPAKTFVTDENGKINVVLTEGTYKAVTGSGKYIASENRFTVTEDQSFSYTLQSNTQIPDRIEISGGQTDAAAGTSTKPFTAKLYDTDGNEITDGISWTWECDKNASVENGIVTIPANAEPDDVITLTVTAEFNGTTITQAVQIKAYQITGYGFGNSYVMIKDFLTPNADNIAVGNSGITMSSSGSNYNGAFIRNSTSTNYGYWPFTSGFQAENDAYYLFVGAGGNNNNEVVTLKLAQPVSAGTPIDIKLAKPRATQKSGTDRTAGNSPLTVVIGSVTLDLQNDYNFDEWKTERIVSDTDISEIQLNLGAWCAVAIESISIDGGDIPSVDPDPVVPSEKIKIMPLGDSITNGFTVAGAYRNQLGSLLVSNGLSDYVDFVGSQNTGNGYDNDNEGHSGWAIDTIPASGDVEGNGRNGLTPQIDTWMDAYTPDIVLLQIGTNDVLSLYDLDNAPKRLETLVDKILAKLPSDGKLYLASIPYISENATYNNTGKTQEELDLIVDTYNSAVKELASEKGLTFVDINGCLTLGDLKDGIHPNTDGYAKMGDLWYNTIESEITSRIEK